MKKAFLLKSDNIEKIIYGTDEEIFEKIDQFVREKIPFNERYDYRHPIEIIKLDLDELKNKYISVRSYYEHFKEEFEKLESKLKEAGIDYEV